MKTQRNVSSRVLFKVSGSVCLIALALSQPLSTLADSPNPNPGVAPIGSNPQGLSYGEWGGLWWKWAAETPAAINPVADETGEFCDVGQPGPVWFLAGNFGGQTTRVCDVPEGKALFFPLLNSLCAAPFDGETEEEVRACANADTDLVTELHCSVDGVELEDLFAYRADSPAFTLNLPEGDIFGIGPIDLYPCVADGYWIMLEPLSKGPHVIQFGGTLVFGPGKVHVFTVDVTYYLLVGD